MYNGGGGGGGSRPPTAQAPEMRYANSGSPRPPTAGSARPYPQGLYQEQGSQQPASYYRPPTQGSQAPPSTSHSNLGYELSDPERRPSMPTPVYDRPSYSRDHSPGGYAGYNDPYGVEETHPLTAYAQRPMTPGTPYDAFEGDTGNPRYPPFLILC